MSKAALYSGLSQGLMSLGEGVSRAIETTTIENMRQQNLERNWQIRQAERAEDRAFRQAESEKDRALRQSQIEATQNYQSEITGLRRDGLAAEESRFQVKQVSDRLSQIDRGFIEQSKQLQEQYMTDPDGLRKAMTALELQRDQQRLQILSGVEESVRRKAGYQGDFESLSRWAEETRQTREQESSQPEQVETDSSISFSANPEEWDPITRMGTSALMGIGNAISDGYRFIQSASPEDRMGAAQATQIPLIGGLMNAIGRPSNQNQEPVTMSQLFAETNGQGMTMGQLRAALEEARQNGVSEQMQRRIMSLIEARQRG